MRLLVRMPTRSRPHQAIHALSLYRDFAGTDVRIEVVLDEDDPSMLSSQVLQRLVGLDCIVTVGKHRSKVEAVNGGRVNDWDVLLLASDDMHPVEGSNYAKRIIEEFDRHWPHLDGALYFNDGHQGDGLCTLPILGRRLYDQFGYVYEPEYQSLFSDLEQTGLLKAMGRLTYVDEKLIEHVHPCWGLAAVDGLYRRNNAFDAVDKATFVSRTARRQERAQWGWCAPPMWFSILIATLPSRRKKLDRLLEHLYAQTAQFPREIEIVIDSDDKLSVGTKRQRLLTKAKGHFIAFVDDDDWVPHNYCRRIVTAIKDNPDADCLSLQGIITTDGARPEAFSHALVNGREWFSDHRGHFRPPNHVSPVRRELALAAGFMDMRWAEDHDYSQRLFPFLKTETSTGDEPLYLYWFDSKKKKGT